MERKSIDYGWVILIIVVIVAIFAYKPITGYLAKRSSESAGAVEFQKAKELFYDYQAWSHPNRSCAMCHTKDYEVNPDQPDIDMPDFKYVELEDVAKKYGYTLLGTPDNLLKQVNRCLHATGRIGYGTLTLNDEKMRLLLLYLRSL